jgi:hypothetical protein
MPFDETWFQFIRENPEKQWSWSAISNNPILSGSSLPHKYPQYPWKWQALACPIPLGTDMFDLEETEWKNVDPYDLETDWYAVSAHPRLPIQVVLDHPEFPWHWYHVSQNPQLTWDIVTEYEHLPWDWSGLSANPMTGWQQSYVEDVKEEIRMEDVD